MAEIINVNEQNSTMAGNLQVFTHEESIKAHQLFAEYSPSGGIAPGERRAGGRITLPPLS